jgi:hypothetical protein
MNRFDLAQINEESQAEAQDVYFQKEFSDLALNYFTPVCAKNDTASFKSASSEQSCGSCAGRKKSQRRKRGPKKNLVKEFTATADQPPSQQSTEQSKQVKSKPKKTRHVEMKLADSETQKKQQLGTKKQSVKPTSLTSVCSERQTLTSFLTRTNYIAKFSAKASFSKQKSVRSVLAKNNESARQKSSVL